MTLPSGSSADPARVAAVRQLLAHLGVTLADLQADPGPRLPTLAEYLPHVVAAAGSDARRAYGNADPTCSRRSDTVDAFAAQQAPATTAW